MFCKFETVVKASKGICESAAAENMFLALDVPVWLCECLFTGEEMALSSLYCSVCQGKFLDTYLNGQANTVQFTLVQHSSLHLCVLLGEMPVTVMHWRLFFLPVLFSPPALLLQLSPLASFLI